MKNWFSDWKTMAFDPNTVDGSEIRHHLGCLKPYKCSNEKSYQPQLVSRISSTNSIAEVEGDSTKLRYLSPQRGATNRTAGFYVHGLHMV